MGARMKFIQLEKLKLPKILDPEVEYYEYIIDMAKVVFENQRKVQSYFDDLRKLAYKRGLKYHEWESLDYDFRRRIRFYWEKPIKELSDENKKH